MEKIAILSLALILFSVIVIILGIVKLHTYPGKVAERRGHPQKDAIEATSLMGLIIFPLWMLALIWSYSGAVIGNLYEPVAKPDPDEDDEGPDTATASKPGPEPAPKVEPVLEIEPAPEPTPKPKQ